MQEHEKALRAMIARVKDGRMSRRAFVQRMVALGLTAPRALSCEAVKRPAFISARPAGVTFPACVLL